MPEGVSEADRRAVEAWFRRRGLPLVVRRRRPTALLQRAVPALVFLLLIDPLVSGLGTLLDVSDEEFDRRVANPGYVVGIFALILGALVVPVLAGSLTAKGMRRLPERVRRVLAGIAVVLTVAVLPLAEKWAGLHAAVVPHVVRGLLTVPALLVLVYLGAGSVLSWALRHALYRLGTIGTLASRALPLLMLVVLFSFFATEVWQVAAALPRWRLWLVVAFLAALATLFLVAVLSEELRDMVRTLRAGPTAELVAHVTGTPLAGLIDDTHERRGHPLTGAERLNIALVLFLAQALQILIFASLVFALFMLFGTLAVQPSVVEAWVGQDPPRGELLGIQLPVTNALVQVSLFLAVFSGLYFTAAAVTDPHYRRSFFEPLLADVRVSLAAREVYLTRWPNAGQPPY